MNQGSQRQNYNYMNNNVRLNKPIEKVKQYFNNIFIFTDATEKLKKKRYYDIENW